jgi:GTP cyclohydrolase I
MEGQLKVAFVPEERIVGRKQIVPVICVPAERLVLYARHAQSVPLERQ